MYKIAICDDSKFMREETRKHILNYSFKKDFDYSLDEYATGEELVSSNKAYDLIFMDYQFDGVGSDGITIAGELRSKGCDAAIIFLSSYPGMVFKSFEVGTFRFLVKPIEDDKFEDAIDSFVQSVKEDSVISLTIDGTTHFIKENMIMYIEGYGKYCLIHLNDGSEPLEYHDTMASVEERLTQKTFYRCIKSFIINLKYVSCYNHSEITLENGETIPISRTKYKEFLDIYSNFLTR